MARYRAIGSVLAALCATALSAQDNEPPLARSIAAGCASCHGTGGVSLGSVPSLAGAGKADIVAKMQEFKNGTRTGTIMPQLAKGYTDEQIELVATWFAAQRLPTK